MGSFTLSSKARNEAKNVGDMRSLAEFLQTAAPLRPETVQVVVRPYTPAPGAQVRHDLSIPPVVLFCDSAQCGRESWFDAQPSSLTIAPKAETVVRFLPYVCRHCRHTYKLYAVRIEHDGGANVMTTDTLKVTKIGEDPPAIGPTPRSLQKLLGDQWALYLNGRLSELTGLGIGAFAYYRRVVEQVWAQVLAELIKVAELEGEPERHAELARAQQERYFTQSLSMAKDHIPRSLFIEGHNPFQALYDACGDGIHEYSDDDCIKRARMIRLVLTKFAERAAGVLSEDKEFRTALGQLTNQGAKAD